MNLDLGYNTDQINSHFLQKERGQVKTSPRLNQN